MPERLSVVVLTESERHALRQAHSATDAKAVGAEVAESLKQGDDTLKNLSRSRELSSEALQGAEQVLQDRLDRLDALAGGEKKRAHRQNVAEALQAIREGLALFE